MENEIDLKVDVAALTDIGCKRTNNEDSFGYDLEAGLFVVCDGMGGSAAGETASATAVRELVEHFSRESGLGLTREERLLRAIVHANEQVYRMAQASEELRGHARPVGDVDDDPLQRARTAGTTGVWRKPMIVVERMAMTRRTMPEEVRMAVFRGMNSCAKYIKG